MSSPDLSLVVLGDPVRHSLSPSMHMAAMAALGIGGTYEARRVDEAGMFEASGEMRAGALDGANITMPHKRLAARIADDLSHEARRAGSVNTWVPIEGRIVGHSTDVIGIRTVIEQTGLSDGRAVILGTGGAAAAALIALEGRPITVVGRRPEVGRHMAEACGIEVEVLSWDEAIPGGLVLNCTAVGMKGEGLPDRFIESASSFFEMVYASGPTPAEIKARAAGIPVAGGLELLAAQAEASFELWTGWASPPGLMYRSGYKHLKTVDEGTES